MMIRTIDDPKLKLPQCFDLQPVETMHANPWFLVRNRGGFFTIEYATPQIIILPIFESEAIVLVKVCRPVIADKTWELPAGRAEDGEIPVACAIRELGEETGIFINEADRFEMETPLIHSLRNPCLPFVYKVSISHSEYECRSGHDHEIAEVAYFKFTDIVDMIKSGEIYIGFHVAIILRYLLKNKWLKLK
jgi:8-oxo-dGTP pyrophosphatase MutT (NUDIX family)